MNRNEQSDDELRKNLASRANGSLAAIADRYLDVLYDFALRTSLDPAVASASVLAALTMAADQVDPAQRLALRPWLLGLTRDDVVERSRARSGRNGDDAGAAPVTESTFSQLAQGAPGSDDSELAAWVWQAARSQRPRDYSLLDLSVRRGLTADEVADATAMSHSGIYAVLGRLRGTLEESFAATLLYHRGGWACPELAAIVVAQPQLGPAARRDIAGHAEACPVCRETRRGYPLPADLLGSFTVLEADSETRRRVLDIEARPAADPAVPVAGLIGSGNPDAEAAAGGFGPEGEDGPGNGAESLPLAADDQRTAAAADAVLPSPDDRGAQTPADGSETDQRAAAGAGLSPAGPDNAVAPGERPSGAAEPVSGGAGASDAELAVAGMAAAAAARQSSAAGPGTFASTPGPRRGRGGNSQRERLAALSRGGSFGGRPPRRPWEGFADWLGENGPGRLSLFILLVGATVLAAYLGLAIGDSIEGGTSNSAATGLAALPTSQPGVRQIACGTGPIDVDQASPITLSFDSDARVLPGFQIGDISVTSASPTADPKSVSAKAQQSLTMALLAQPLPGTPGRVDEYKLRVTFTKSAEKAISECTVRVHAPLVTPTVAASGTASVTPSSTPRPAGQATVPAAVTSAPAPTGAPGTAVPPTLTPVRTATGTPTRVATP